jgi:hypothetical protein
VTIKYIPEGDLFRANQLWGEGRHQLSVLKNAMSFQNLKQDQRLVRFADGSIIKCWSCFGQDVINIFVPQVFVGGEPKYREREEVTYYPAIEVYDSPYWTATYLGIVICRGGGFEPPYEFIPKDSLPRDTATVPKDKLPEERIWEPEETRELEDIVPKGIADVEDVKPNNTEPTMEKSGVRQGDIARLEESNTPLPNSYGFEYQTFFSGAAETYTDERSESFREDYTFSYIKPGEADPGYWDEIWFEGFRHWNRKPSTVLNIDPNLFWEAQGGGTNYYYCNWDVHDHTTIKRSTIKWVLDGVLFGIPFGHYEYDDTVTGINTSQIAFDQLTARADESIERCHSDYGLRTQMYRGEYSYTHYINYSYLWNYYGSVMDENYFAIAYSSKNQKFSVNNYRSVYDMEKCIHLSWGYEPEAYCLADAKKENIIKDEKTEGPLCVTVDGEIFELYPEAESEVSPRLQDCNLRYFRVGGKSIGLFRIGKNYYDPLDYSYVYAEVMHPEDKNISNPKHVITEVIDPEAVAASDAPQLVGSDTVRFSVKTDTSQIKYMKDSDGNTLYGKDGIRLIKETIVVKEMATAEQPGLFRKII